MASSRTCVQRSCLILTALFTITVTAEAGASTTELTNNAKVALVPLPLRLPLPSMANNGPSEIFEGSHIARVSDRPRPAFLAPRGVTNVALGKAVTSSASKPLTGRLAQITDGQKEPVDDQVVEFSLNSNACQEIEVYALPVK